MKEAHQIQFDKQVYYRLIALWVLCEAFLGGIIHGLKIPVSGLVVGGGAIICICLIAYYVPLKGAIIKATIIVAIFKMMLSPHSPPTAYIAVFFQGLLGQLLFLNFKFYRISCVVLAVLSMIESAMQRILVLVILYGTQFWNAVDQYLSKLTNQETITAYSLWVASGYLLMHAFAGVFVGWFAGSIAVRSRQWITNKEYLIDNINEEDVLKKPLSPSKRKRILKLSFFIIWTLLIIVFLQSVSGIGTPLLPKHASLQILFRSLLIVLTWYFLVGPLVLMLIRKWLEKKKQNRQGDIQQVMLMLPSTKYIVITSWQIAKGNTRWERIKKFIKILLTNTLKTSDAR